MSTVTTANKTKGLDHVPTKDSLVYDFCNSLWSKVEGKSANQKRHQTHKGCGIQKTAIIDHHEKTGTGSYYTGTIRVSRLHDLLSRHQRPNGEGIQVPVGDISKVEGGKGQLRRPSPSLQYLMECAVPPEEQ